MRVSKRGRGAQDAISYIVAVADPTESIALIRAQVAGPDDDIEDLGRVLANIWWR
jgi:hypothetical protein